MARFVALLRGINVGGHRVAMARLRDEFETLGFAGVRTYIASGNVVFDTRSSSAAALERRIAAHLGQALGYDVPTFIRTPDELHAIVEREAFSAAEVAAAHAVHVVFLPEALGADEARAVATLETADDAFRIHGREIYWRCGRPFSESRDAAAAFTRVLRRQPTTMRNLGMLKRLAASL